MPTFCVFSLQALKPETCPDQLPFRPTAFEGPSASWRKDACGWMWEKTRHEGQVTVKGTHNACDLAVLGILYAPEPSLTRASPGPKRNQWIPLPTNHCEPVVSAANSWCPTRLIESLKSRLHETQETMCRSTAREKPPLEIVEDSTKGYGVGQEGRTCCCTLLKGGSVWYVYSTLPERKFWS